MRRLCLLLCVPALMACDGELSSLRDFGATGLSIEYLPVTLGDNDGPWRLTVRLDRPDGECLTLRDEVRASVDGAPVDLTSRGEWVMLPHVGSGANLGPQRHCYTPYLELDGAVLGDAPTIVIEDDTHRIALQLSQPSERRSGEVVTQGPLRAGDPVEVRWSRPSTGDVGVVVRQGDDVWLKSELQLTQVDGGARLTLPGALREGSAMLEFSEVLPAVPRCEGVSSCGWGLFGLGRVDVPIDVAP